MTPDLPTSAPAGLAAWLVCLGAVMWIANQTWKFTQNMRGPQAQPPNQQLALSHDELARRISILEQDGRTRSAGMYRKIDEVRTELKEDIGEMDAKFDRKMESLPERLITLLRNTGAIGKNRDTD